MENKKAKVFKFYKIKAPIVYIGTFNNPKSEQIKNSQFLVIESKDKKYQMRASLRFANTFEGFITTSYEQGTLMNAYDTSSEEEVAFKVEDLPKVFELEEFTPPKSTKSKKERKVVSL